MRFITILIWACAALGGLVVCIYARRLSLRYNAWTTALRTRRPDFNPPPTPKARERNTKIMIWLFRILGIWVFVLALLVLLDVAVRH